MYTYSNDDICNKIWKIEKEYNLLEYKIDDINIWKLIRVPIYVKICSKFGLFQENATYSLTKNEKIISKINLLKIALKNEVIKGKYKKDILVFNHNRKVYVDNNYIDPSSYYIIKELEKKCMDFEIIDMPHNDRHYIEKSNNIKYGEGTYLIKNYLIKVLKNYIIKNKKSILKTINYLEDIIENEFSIKLDITNLVFDSLYNFKCRTKFYERLIKKREVKEIYVVVGYYNQDIIAAAKKNKVKVIEIQHGVIDKYHLGYSFPNNKNVPYFPDVIFLYGQYWYDSSYIPIDKDNVKVIGNPYMENRIKKYKNIDKINNRIIFLSQWTIGDRLSNIACEFALNNPEYEVIYKLHPEEYESWDNKYNLLRDNRYLKNLKIIDNNDINLYELLATSEYQVGVYSTAIYEGIMLNCKTILVNLPGVSHIDYLINNNNVRLINNHIELSDIIKSKIDLNLDLDINYIFRKSNIM